MNAGAGADWSRMRSPRVKLMRPAASTVMRPAGLLSSIAIPPPFARGLNSCCLCVTAGAWHPERGQQAFRRAFLEHEGVGPGGQGGRLFHGVHGEHDDHNGGPLLLDQPGGLYPI